MPRQTSYDPERAPDPAAWLAEPEQERIRVAATFHSVHRLKSGNAKAHAAIHVIVENQIASGFGPTVRAMARLQGQGLSRHDAIHAVGSVVSEFMLAALRDPPATDAESLQAQVNAAIEQLDAAAWHIARGA
jgi:hypothetical protein